MVDMDVWGPALWKAFHLVALGYSASEGAAEREGYRAFYEGFGNVLPCHKCRAHYAANFSTLDINDYLQSPEALFAWTVAMHNRVNASKGYREMSIKDAHSTLLSMEHVPNRRMLVLWMASSSILLGIVIVLSAFMIRQCATRQK